MIYLQKRVIDQNGRSPQALKIAKSGAEWRIEDFGEVHLPWFQSKGLFKNGIPVHDTIARVISQINPKQFQTCFICWMASCHEITAGDVIAIDGKTVRRSFDKSKKQGAIHMVSAFSTANKVVLGQLKTAAKSNESVPWALKLTG